MNSFSIFPDVNVLLALTVRPHPQYRIAQQWFKTSGVQEIVLCRSIQLSYLRLLTTRAAMGNETLSNEDAWQFLDRLSRSVAVHYAAEPASVTMLFRERSSLRTASPNRWMDAYLSAFASESRLRLVTFDSSLSRYTPRSILLRP